MAIEYPHRIQLSATIQITGRAIFQMAISFEELNEILRSDLAGDLARKLATDAIIAIAKRRAAGNLDPL